MTAAVFLRLLSALYSALVKTPAPPKTIFGSISGLSVLGLPNESAVNAVFTYAQRTCCLRAASAALLPPGTSVAARELPAKAAPLGTAGLLWGVIPELIRACDASAASVSGLGALPLVLTRPVSSLAEAILGGWRVGFMKAAGAADLPPDTLDWVPHRVSRDPYCIGV